MVVKLELEVVLKHGPTDPAWGYNFVGDILQLLLGGLKAADALLTLTRLVGDADDPASEPREVSRSLHVSVG